MALREQNAHIQRKVASGEGGEDLLEGGEAQQKVHGKVSDLDKIWPERERERDGEVSVRDATERIKVRFRPK